MSALTKAISYTKRLFIVGVVILAGIIIMSFITSIVSKIIKNNKLAHKNQIATQSFGSIVPPVFKSISLPSGDNPSYILSTPSGGFPQVGNIMNIYKVISPQISIDSLANAQTIVSNMGVQNVNSYKQLGDVQYEWQSNEHNIIFNIDSLNFTINLTTSINSYLSYQAQNQYTTNNFSSPSDAVSTVYDFLSSLSTASASQNSLIPSLNISNFSTVPVSINPESGSIDLSNVTGALTNGYYVFYSKNINGYKVYSDNPKTSTIQFLIDSTDISNLDSLIQASFVNYRINTSSYSTYYIISPETAYSEIKSGKGSLVYISQDNTDSLSPESSPQAVSKFYINNISLGYYQGNNYRQYLTPIYVFSGVAYFANGTQGIFDYYVNALY